MPVQIPILVSIFFILITIATFYLFYRSTVGKDNIAVIIIIWLTLQAIVSGSGFYLETNIMPPRFLLLIGPPIIFIILLFLFEPGKKFLDRFDPEKLTWIHTVRVPVELVLYWLFVYKQIPQVMTFEGRNFDILSGLTAPLIILFGYRSKKISSTIIILWNIVCLALLFNIVIHAVLSAPFPFQKFGFNQPNVGVFYFPYTWLPGFIVPVVLFSHLVSLRFHLKNR